MRKWTKPFVHNNRYYEATFHSKPFHGGLEALVTVEGNCVRVHDIFPGGRGMCEGDLLKKLKSKIDQHLAN